MKTKLKDEYKDLKGVEIGMLKKEGVEITKQVLIPWFCYICDTSIEVFNNKNIVNYNNIIIECTFLYKEHLERVDSTKHIHWFQLEEYVKNNKNTVFILIHFSLRYTNEEVQEFFIPYKTKYKNIVIWIDTKEPYCK